MSNLISEIRVGLEDARLSRRTIPPSTAPREFQVKDCPANVLKIVLANRDHVRGHRHCQFPTSRNKSCSVWLDDRQPQLGSGVGVSAINAGEKAGVCMDKYFRRQIKKRSRGICERCNLFTAEHIHHLTYARFGHERLEDVQHVCLGCHEFFHPHHNFRSNDGTHKKERKLNWASIEKQAKKELAEAARFNNMPLSRRRSF
jgi:hypothetical protein